MIVVDASALLKVLLHTPAAAPLQERPFEPGQDLHAPHLLDVEVAQALRRYAASGPRVAERCRAALADLADLSLERRPHEALLPRVWELRASLTAYDAICVGLAEALDAELLTRDRRLAGAPGHRARVVLV